MDFNSSFGMQSAKQHHQVNRLSEREEGGVEAYMNMHRHTQIYTDVSYLACGDTWSMMVFMMRGTNSDTTLWMFSLYSWGHRAETQSQLMKN